MVHDRPTQASSSVYIKAEKAYSKGQLSLAKKYYLELLTQESVNIKVFFRLGNISLRESRWNDALGYYVEVLKKRPQHEQTHHNLAMLHLSRAHEHMKYYIQHYPARKSVSMEKLVNAIGEYSQGSKESITTIIDRDVGRNSFQHVHEK